MVQELCVETESAYRATACVAATGNGHAWHWQRSRRIGAAWTGLLKSEVLAFVALRGSGGREATGLLLKPFPNTSSDLQIDERRSLSLKRRKFWKAGVVWEITSSAGSYLPIIQRQFSSKISPPVETAMARGKTSRSKPAPKEQTEDSDDDRQTLKKSVKATFSRDETFNDSEDECTPFRRTKY